MLTIQNITKLIGSKLDKKNYVVKNVYEDIGWTNEGVQTHRYVFDLHNDKGHTTKTILYREHETDAKYGNTPHYKLVGFNSQIKLLKGHIQNRDQLIDCIREVSIQ